MSDDPKMRGALLKALEHYSEDDLARIVERGIKQLESEELARQEWKAGADDRLAFMIADANKLKAERPELSPFEIVAIVRRNMIAQGSRLTFGNGKIPKEDTILLYLRRAGVFSAKSSAPA